jgi:uncharacterized peroxidase-related enzyme
MPWIRVIGPEEAEGELGEAYGEVGRSRGKVAGVVSVHSLNPRALKAMMELYMAIMYGESHLSRTQREMIATAVSAANRCGYCVSHHGEALRARTKDDDLVKMISTDYRQAPLEAVDLALLDYAVKLTARPEAVTEEDIGRLRASGLDDRAILDANLVASTFNYFNRVVMGLGVELEEDRGAGYRY